MTLALCRALLRIIARVVPARDRADWLREWEAELAARWQRLALRHELDGRQQMNVLRRTLGSLHDAAWLRRQFTRDAELVHDLRHGLRLLRRRPGFTALAVLVLALGVGATLGIFSVVDFFLLRPLPYAEPERIVTLWQASASTGAREDVAPGNFLEWRARARSLAHLAAAEPWSLTLVAEDRPLVLPAVKVSEGFFELFGVQPVRGRTFTPDEFQKGRDAAVVLSHAVWTRHFGGDPSVVGQPVRFDDETYVVVGVLPPSFQPRLLPSDRERGVWLPKTFEEWEPRVRGGGYWNVVGRLKPGVSLAGAQAELDTIAAQLAREYPRTNAGVGIAAVPLRDHLAGSLRPALGVLLGAVCLLLLVAAANVANLLLARGAEREREIAVRAALGAGRGRLARQLLAESLLLAGAGAAAGLLFAHWTLRAVATLGPADVPRLTDVSIDARVLVFAVLLTGAVALLVGLLPAWQASGRQPLDVLRRWGAGRGSSARPRLRATLVVSEVALAMLLTTGAGLLVRSFATLLHTELGFTPDRVAALQVFVHDRQPTPEKRAAFVHQVVARLQGAAEVEEAGAVSAMPFIEANMNIETALTVEGRPAPPHYQEPTAFVTIATAGYFRALRIPLRDGRLFDEGDRADSEGVALVSEALARREWPGTSPLDAAVQFRYRGRPLRARVVGVVAEVRHDGIDRPARPELFVPHAQVPSSGMTFVARTAAEPRPLLRSLEAHIHALDPGQPVYRMATAPELVARSLADRRFTLTLLGASALLAVLLAATGIYGVISLATAQRTREFGVRLALGAGRSQIVAMVLREGAVLTVAGLLLGLAVSLAAGRVLTHFLYGISATDPLTLAVSMAALGTVSMLACMVPARRATRTDPLVVLRAE